MSFLELLHGGTFTKGAFHAAEMRVGRPDVSRENRLYLVLRLIYSRSMRGCRSDGGTTARVAGIGRSGMGSTIHLQPI